MTNWNCLEVFIGEGNSTPLQYSCLENPWTEEPGRLQSMGSQRVRHDWVTSLSLSCIGEGNGNPLQCSCLKNPRDGGAWWAAISGVAQSRTQLKRLISSSSNRSRDIKKRWQEYTEELYKKDQHNPDNHNGVITHLEPDILECESSGP